MIEIRTIQHPLNDGGHWFRIRLKQRLHWAVLSALLAIVITACRSEPIPEDGPAYAAAHYNKREFQIPMRDGVKLYTVVYSPKNTAITYPILLMRTPYRAGPYGTDEYRPLRGPGRDFARDGYIFVFQDVRGKFRSEGHFVNMRPHRSLTGAAAKSAAPTDASSTVDESTDAYDTIEWLLHKIPGHNGRVGMWGISYPGFYSAAGMIDTHPALVAVSPQAPIADWYWDDMHHHGAFTLALAFRFFATFGQKRPEPISEWPKRFDFATPDGYGFYLDLGPLKHVNERYFHGDIDFWNHLAAHPNYDEFWQKRNLLPHLRNIKSNILTVGGFFDAEDLYGPLHIYREIEDHNPGIQNTLVMGPWTHGGWRRTDGESLGLAHFGAKTSHIYQEHVIGPFFRHYLKGGPKPNLPEVLAFETGHNRWHGFSTWPPPSVRTERLLLAEGGRAQHTSTLPSQPAEVATTEGPVSDSQPAAQPAALSPALGTSAAEIAHDAFISDPAKPVPYTMSITTNLAKTYMTEDQRFAAWRPDVLVYQTEPLENDVTLAGPMRADLWVSTTGTAADWVVKIIDVFPGQPPEDPENEESSAERAPQSPTATDQHHRPYPGGYQMLVRGEIMRGRFRNSYERPEPFVPDTVTKVSFELWDTFHTFRKGHRIMVQVQSSWFPLFDRNPQTYVANIFNAEEADFRPATHRIHRSRAFPSSIAIGVLDLSAASRWQPPAP